MPKTEIVAIIMNPSGQVLVGRSTLELGRWTVPGATQINSYEPIATALARGVLDQTGIIVQPQNVMFVSEMVKPPAEHRIVICGYAVYVSGEPSPGEDMTEVKWVDVRNLGDIQDELSDVAVDAFYKFSLVLRSQAVGGGLKQ
jgi:8-oxo-dGTP diphosphatase